MAIIFTIHAEEMLVKRKVKRKQVEECVRNPDKIVTEKEGVKAYLKDFGKNYLRLIVSEMGNNFVIITLHWVAKKRIKE